MIAIFRILFTVIFVKLLLAMFIYTDYFIVGILVFFGLSESLGVHMAISLIATIASLGLVYFLNQLTVKNVYIFKILGSRFWAQYFRVGLSA